MSDIANELTVTLTREEVLALAYDTKLEDLSPNAREYESAVGKLFAALGPAKEADRV